jgi:hypothetical protein
MKAGTIIIFWITVTLLLLQCDREHSPGDPVPIPDQAFRDALLHAGVDLNGDSLITYGEARAVEVLALSNFDYPCWPLQDSAVGGPPAKKSSISSMEGIQAFENLLELGICGRGIEQMDVSQNAKLTHLICGHNELTSLEVSHNLELLVLECGGNHIRALDLSENVKLSELWCESNPIESLDLSLNPDLDLLCCASTPLTRLDLSNNKQLKTLLLYDMPELQEVCVWTTFFPGPPPYYVYVDTTGSPHLFFNNGCLP